MDHQEISALRIVRDALDTEPGDRARFVELQCSGNEELHARVHSMLERIAAADPNGDESATGSPGRVNVGAETPLEWDDPLVRSRLGPYRIIERIGRGGMGIVYRGMREGADFAQEVAIKLIRRGYDFDDVHARFLRERRILARLSHPNLARFIDGGVTDEGRPWFALEFVDGQPITTWCDERRLDISARVRLFLDVCTAVQYAHTQLVVHRDLKPSNVLVDASGAVRLLDFGVAGLLAPDADGGDRPSTIGMRQAFTPEYAAPEQFTGEAVGVSSDVFALGVILYELLSGALPYPINRQDMAAAERTVREMPPQALVNAVARTQIGTPSAQATTTGREVTESRLALRGQTFRSYRNLVRGDLSRIVEKALAKEPARRYATVDAYASDLARWLRGLPIHVSGNSLRYRSGKFVARNRVLVSVSMVALIALMAGITGTLWQARKAMLAANVAQQNAQRATAARDFLASMLSGASPEENGGKDTSVRDVLDRASKRVTTELATQPELRVEMSTLIGKTYNDLAAYEDAIAILKQAVLGADKNPSISIATRGNAHGQYATALLSRNPTTPAESEARVAVDLLRTQPISEALGAALDSLATALYQQGRYEEALSVQREAMQTVQSLHGSEGKDYADALLELSYFLDAAGHPDAAVDASKQSLAILDRLYPDASNPAVSRALWALGNSLSSANREPESLLYLRRAESDVIRIYGKDSLKYMRSVQILGVAELGAGDVVAAAGHLLEAEEMLKKQAPDHPMRPLVLEYLGEARLRNGDIDGAALALKPALEMAKKTPRTDVIDKGTILLARVLTAQGKLDESAALLDARLPSIRSAKSRFLMTALIAKAEIHRQNRKLDIATACLDEAQSLSTDPNPGSQIQLLLERARVADSKQQTSARVDYAKRVLDLLASSDTEQAPESKLAQSMIDK